MNHLLRVCIASLLISLPAGTIAGAAPDYARTCAYFDNFAFNDRHTRTAETFRLRLARDCHDALETLTKDGNSAAVTNQAGAYLAVLSEYQAILQDIVVARFVRGRETQTRAPRDMMGRAVTRPISRAGAYLIARRLGLVERQREWRDGYGKTVAGRTQPE